MEVVDIGRGHTVESLVGIVKNLALNPKGVGKLSLCSISSKKKRMENSLIMKEIKIKVAVRYYFSSIRLLKKCILNLESHSVGKPMGIRNAHILLVGRRMV